MIFYITCLIEYTWGADVNIEKTNPKSSFLRRFLQSKNVNFHLRLGSKPCKVMAWH